MIDIKKLYLGEFPSTGAVNINLPYLYQIWSWKCVICEWKADDTYRLVITPKLNSKRCIKWTISKEQAMKIANDIGLIPVHVAFKSGYDWRTKKDWYNLEQYRLHKIKPTPC